ncbi:12916_t:CDS:2 [Cetraspora pellucida]|uniref:12916_t:CDS:1 n=1 Tax=Cetraspora pellucida TaxID=1433469 RepID=A0A9N9DQK6_9GLOM|nr:12916_t:CDS:2 [Cetraspora pellucida]
MIGYKNDIVQKLSQICSYIVYNYYIVHCLVLAYKDSQKQIDYFNNVKTIIRDVYKYYKNSAKQVQEYQQILDYYLTLLNKFFQKSNLYFQDIIPIINATTTIIQKDYLIDTLNIRNYYLGYNLQPLSIKQITAKTINNQKFLPLIDELLLFLVHNYFDIFPNMIKLAHITNSIPFSSVNCERGFSKQNTIKTHLRISLTTFTLDAFMRILLEGKKSKEMN